MTELQMIRQETVMMEQLSVQEYMMMVRTIKDSYLMGQLVLHCQVIFLVISLHLVVGCSLEIEKKYSGRMNLNFLSLVME